KIFVFASTNKRIYAQFWVAHPSLALAIASRDRELKDRCGETPKPTRGTRVLPGQFFLGYDLPFFNVAGVAHGQCHAHCGDRVESTAAKWKFDYLGKLALGSAGNLFVKQTDMRISRWLCFGFRRVAKIVHDFT